MREHQIVITLKPEQFLEVQRLARAAKAKSMGIFVRQQLLAALGIDGQPVAPQEADSVDLTVFSAELKRLHSELRTFVVESLTQYSLDGAAAASESISAEAPVNDSFESVATESADYFEQVAEKAFAISPRLGAIGEDITGRDVAGRDAYALPPGPIQLQDQQTLAAGSIPHSEQGGDSAAQHTEGLQVAADVASVEQVTIFEQDNTVGAHVPISATNKLDTSSAREMHRYHQNSAKELMDVPFSCDSEDRNASPVRERYEQAVVSESGREVSWRRDQIDPQPDHETNQLQEDIQANAVNAFATQTASTGTGNYSSTIDSSVFEDPLEKLLGGADVSTLSRRPAPVITSYEDEDDDLFDVPLSIAERNRQMVAQKAAADPVSDDRSLEKTSTAMPPSNQTGDLSAPSVSQGIAENTVVENASAKPLPVRPEPPKPSAGRPLGYPPVSGNPPPKRRQV